MGTPIDIRNVEEKEKLYPSAVIEIAQTISDTNWTQIPNFINSKVKKWFLKLRDSSIVWYYCFNASGDPYRTVAAGDYVAFATDPDAVYVKVASSPQVIEGEIWI